MKRCPGLVAMLIFACTAASRAACPAATHAAGPTLVLTGSSTVAPLAAEIGKRFETLHPGVRINVQTGGSSRGVVDARQGTSDIGMVSRALKAKERQDLRAFTIARDGVGLIVHSSNSVATLSDDQVVGIYTGKITDWKQVGGTDGLITVVSKAEGRSTLELFLSYFHLQSSQIEPHIIIGDNEQAIKTVAGNRNAIGYVSIGTAEYDVARGVPIRLLPIAGVAATIDNVHNGTFPISRPLNLVTRDEPSGLVDTFIDFARSAQVHDLVRQQYFVPVGE